MNEVLKNKINDLLKSLSSAQIEMTSCSRSLSLVIFLKFFGSCLRINSKSRGWYP